MTIKTLFILAISATFLVQCTISNSLVEQQPKQIPYCSATYIAPPTYEAVSQDFIIYTGTKELHDGWQETREVIIQAPTRQWGKQKIANCESTLEADCFTLAPKEEAAIYKSYTVLTDTTYINEYEIWSEIIYTKNNETSSMNLTVLCEKEVPTNLIESLQRRLTEEGQYSGTITGLMDIDTKVALMNYQEKNNLPTAGLDTETLERLYIDPNLYY